MAKWLKVLVSLLPYITSLDTLMLCPLLVLFFRCLFYYLFFLGGGGGVLPFLPHLLIACLI